MDDKQRRAADRMRRERSQLRQAGYPTDLCLSCGRTVRATFSSSEFPELLAYLKNDLSLEQLARVVRGRLGSEGCFLAVRCGVSICDRKELP